MSGGVCRVRFRFVRRVLSGERVRGGAVPASVCERTQKLSPSTGSAGESLGCYWEVTLDSWCCRSLFAGV